MPPSDGHAPWGRSDTRNELSGTVHGPSLQAATIRGDVYLGAVPRQRPPVPRQLPPRPRYFTNREAGLEVLDHALARARREDSSALVSISGLPGVGKTSLALSWLHRHSDDFADGQLYAGLEGHRVGEPTSPAHVLPRFLQALGVAPEHVPFDLAGQMAHFRTVTAGRRIAVLCDNALSAAQVRPLMPASAGSVCVVTSRWHLRPLVLDGAEFVRLDPLDTDSAIELLGNMAGHERVAADAAAARELVLSCGRFPLAVCVSAALLVARPGWSMATAVTGPAVGSPFTEADEEVSMTTRLDQVYTALPDDAARLYRRMGLHPGSEFDVGVAEAAAAVRPEIPAPAEGLATLVHANLLGMDQPGRYHFHDLIHEHARHRGEADDDRELRAVTERRIIDHYLATADSADHVVHPHRRRPVPEYRFPPEESRTFADFATALGWFEEELANLMAVLRLASERGHDAAAWQIVDAMWGVFIYTRYHRDWIASHEIGAEAAHACRHRLGEARMRTGLGMALRDTGRYEEALAAFDQALALRREIGDRPGEALVLHNVGLVHMQREELDRAGELFADALAIREAAADTRGEAKAHLAIGEVKSLRGHDDDALRHLTKAMDMIAGKGDRNSEILARRLLGQAYLRAGDRPAARAQLETALAELRGAGAVFDEGTLREILGEVAEQDGNPLSARGHYARAETVYRKLGALPHAERAAGHRRRLDPDADPDADPGTDPGTDPDSGPGEPAEPPPAPH
ncbi:tetratricopeptide repeat protein [Streptomyces sp. CMB-StM0423]|uniref:tetratricopeptide repeat protein n=1 Tax=Streptomyces sp. CMB-StM0423 TaxID=2059884 RepID=UPI00131C0710|nr:tetratricopeptide repeat protein [Streptomyces sp. CMB-StM0423]